MSGGIRWKVVPRVELLVTLAGYKIGLFLCNNFKAVGLVISSVDCVDFLEKDERECLQGGERGEVRREEFRKQSQTRRV